MMLQYTGHPIADVGVATIAAFCQKFKPEDLTPTDLALVAEYMLTHYTAGSLTPYLSCVFTMNAVYTQPSWDLETRKREARQLLFSFRQAPDPAADGLRCIFSGEPASRIVYRQHVPMLTGENVLNFFPAGTGGLPISGPYLLAIQAFPLGARRCSTRKIGGGALAVHSPDDPDLTYAFAQRFLAENRQLLLLAEQSGEKYQDAKAPKTLVIHTLLDIERERRGRGEDGRDPSVTVYHLTNSGQGPDIDLFHLPSEVVRFLRAASRAGTQQIWRRIEATAWEKVAAEARQTGRKGRAKKGKTAKSDGDQALTWGPGKSRNYLYEDVFDLPHNASAFVRTYFLRRAYRYAREGDPRQTYRLNRDLELVSWELTRLFLKEVMGMERNRIEAIRTLGDRIAEHIASDNDRRFFQGFYLAGKYGVLRNRLLKASNARLKKGQPPLIGFDEFLLVFEEGEEMARMDWGLARDLVLIRVIEELHRRGWFGKQPEVLDELDAQGEETAERVS